MSDETLVLANKVANAVDSLLGYWSSNLRCRFANSAYEMWFGKSSHEMLGISIDEFLGASYELSLPHIRGALNGEIQVFERTITRPDGTICHCLASYYPDVDDGTVLGFMVHAVDVTAMKQLEFELDKCKKRAERLASHDFLTGLPNRYLLIDRISGLLSQAESSGTLLGIALMDIDNFRRINETYGHDVGDGVLREIARRMKGAIHPTETVIRMDGDEFLLLTPGLRSAVEASVAISRLLRAVQQPLQYGGAAFIPTLSFGNSLFPLNGSDASELLTRADRDLVQSKKFGNSSPARPALPK
jgi:diguanylate cyclase (GGDEF)-like protein/PAS domain S-box-containing protein